MPLYEYECKACGKVLEVRQKISDPAPTTCTACAQGPLVKLMSRTSFILKGNGWYVTDFKGGSTASTSATSESGESKTSVAESPAAPAAASPSPTTTAPPTASDSKPKTTVSNT